MAMIMLHATAIARRKRTNASTAPMRPIEAEATMHIRIVRHGMGLMDLGIQAAPI